MKAIEWRKLPPLSALRALEATAQTGSFVAAGRALNVTHAAIAQQVRGLENHLGYPLALRDGRALALTEEGRRLAEAVSEGFATIERALDLLSQERTGQALSVTMPPVFAERWLVPRLKSFWTSHPEIALTLRPDHRVLDLRRERVDVAIRFGLGRWPGVNVSYLTSARFVVVAAPQFASPATTVTASAMEALPWITDGDSAEPVAWLLAHGIDTSQSPTTELPTEELALAAVRQGLGLYVTSAALIEEDVAAGTLSVLMDARDENPGYYVVTPDGTQSRAARLFVKWLKASV